MNTQQSNFIGTHRVGPLIILYVGYLFVLTLYPFVLADQFSEALRVFFWGFVIFVPKGLMQASARDVVLNILLFIPLGLLLYSALKNMGRSAISSVALAALAGGVLSFVIEFCQVFFDRHAAASDVFANTMGSAGGALLAMSCPVGIKSACGSLWNNFQTSKVAVVAICLYGALPLILSVIQSPWPKFRTWNTNFTFQLGNEASFNRPWLGKIYLVAVYNRALSHSDVAQHFRLGFSVVERERSISDGIVALYTFTEGGGDRVVDRSKLEPPLNLVIMAKSGVRWMGPSGGIEILQPAIIKSEERPKKLSDAFKGRDELSVEVWCAPVNVTQAGPARIVSFSGGVGGQNFMLGQEGLHFVLRLRTLIAGSLGRPVVLKSTDGSLAANSTVQVVATYARGVERFYINGMEQPGVVDVTKDVLIGFGTTKTPIPEIAYTFFFFFPVSLAFSMFLLSRGSSLYAGVLISIAVSLGLLVITDIYQVFAFHRTVDFRVIGCGAILVTTASLVGSHFSYRGRTEKPD